MTTTAKTKTPTSPAVRALRLAAAKVGSTARPQGGHCTRLAQDTGAKVNLSTRAGFNTGSWRFEQGKHVIVLGEDFDRVLLPYGKTRRPKMAALFGEAILRHEAWHGRVSHRDLDAIAAQCRTRAIPFVLVNLFEDARLEQCARVAEAKPFRWGMFYLAQTVACPLTSFISAMHHEDGRVRGWKAGPNWEALRDKVQEFYDRAIACADTFAIVDLAQEWVEYWNANGYGKGTQVIDANSPRANDTIGTDTDGSLTQYKQDPNAQVHTTVTVANAQRDHIRTDAPVRVDIGRFRNWRGAQPLDRRLADRMAQRMRDVVARAASPRSARVSTSASRLHIPGVAVGSEQAFRSHGKTGGKPSLVVLVDFSGSMSRDWDQHGRYFVAAVLRLVRQGLIDAKLYATGGGLYAEIPVTLTDVEVDRLGPSKQGENIRATLDTVAAAMQQAHATVIYTDAELMDGSVDAQAWRRRGVDLIGAVVIPATRDADLAERQRGEMRRHFGSSVTAPNGDALAMKLAQYLGQRFTG